MRKQAGPIPVRIPRSGRAAPANDAGSSIPEAVIATGGGNILQFGLDGQVNDLPGTGADQFCRLITGPCAACKFSCIRGHGGVLPGWLSEEVPGATCAPSCAPLFPDSGHTRIQTRREHVPTDRNPVPGHPSMLWCIRKQGSALFHPTTTPESKGSGGAAPFPDRYAAGAQNLKPIPMLALFASATLPKPAFMVAPPPRSWVTPMPTASIAPSASDFWRP